ncbi:hypothetical protein ACFLYN_04050 [Chloroflexota bacterium]
MEKVSSSIENIEGEAEKLLESARTQANEILVKANEESQQILSAEFSTDDIKADCQKIVEKAKGDADNQAGDSTKKAKEVKEAAEKKVDEIAQRITNMVTGADTK